jgi:hypothetical protein
MRFPDNVFLDVQALKAGMLWSEEIRENAANCDVFLPVIGPDWLKEQDDESGVRRLDQPEDWVRLEIEIALARDPQPLVIPVLVGGAKMPKSAHLPATISKLPDFQFQVIDPSDFERDVELLVSTFPKTLHAKGRGGTAQRVYPDGDNHQTAEQRAERVQAATIDYGAFLRNRLEGFVGRSAELAEVHSVLRATQRNGGYLTITGQAGQGKSSIIAKLIDTLVPERPVVHIIPFTPGPDHQIVLMRNLIAQLILKHGLSDVYLGSESRAVLSSSLARLLQEIDGPEIIFIDGLDQIQQELYGDRDLTFLPVTLPAGVVCVIGTRPNDTLKPLELLKPHQEYQLPALSEGDFGLMLERNGVYLPSKLIHDFYLAMGAHALYLDLAAKELALGQTAPADLLRRLTPNPESIFSLSIERLKLSREQWQTVLKPMLGVLLVAEEPLSIAALREIVGVDGNELREGLLKLGGLVNRDSFSRYQLFHLKFTDYLRSGGGNTRYAHALFDQDDRAKWHLKLADWCQEGSFPFDAWTNLDGGPVKRERCSYGLAHLLKHLYQARRWTELWSHLDNMQFGQAKLRYDPSGISYTYDLDLGCIALVSEGQRAEERRSTVSRLWRYLLQKASLNAVARSSPEQLFTLLVVRGFHDHAVELAGTIGDPASRARAFCRIGQAWGFLQRQRDDILQVLLTARGHALEVDYYWDQADLLSEIAEVLAENQLWDQAVATCFLIGSSRSRVDAFGAVLERLACAGERKRFQELLEKADRQAHLAGLLWGRENLYKTMDGFLQNPDASREALAQLAAGAPAVVQSIFASEPQSASEYLTNPRSVTAADSVRIYARLVRCLFERRSPLRVSADWDWIRRYCGGLREMIESSLLLAMAGMQAEAAERLSGLLDRTASLQQGVDRVAALLLLDEDVSSLSPDPRGSKYRHEILEGAVAIARTLSTDEQRNQMLRKISTVFVKAKLDDRAAAIEIEAGGGPLTYWQPENPKEEEELLRHDFTKWYSFTMSDAYFNFLLESGDFQSAVKIIRASGPPEDIDPEVAVSSEVQDALRSAVEKRTWRMAALIKNLFDNGEVQEARALLPEMIQYVNSLQYVPLKARELVGIFHLAIDIGESEVGVGCGDEAVRLSREDSVALSDMTHAQIVARHIHGLVRVGQLARAENLIRTDLEAWGEADGDVEVEILRMKSVALGRIHATDRVVALLHNRWPKAGGLAELLRLLPLASPIAAEDSSQRDEMVRSLQEPDLMLGARH